MIDLQTLFIMTISVHFVIAISMLIYWKTQKTYPGFGYWAMSNVVAATLYVLTAARPILPVFVSIIVGNIAAILAIMIRYEGVRAFTGQTVATKKRNIVSLLSIFIILVYFTYVDDNPLMRLFFLTIWLIYYGGCIAIGILKGGTISHKLTPWIISISHVFCGIVLVFRNIVWFLDPSARNALQPVFINIMLAFTEHIMDVIVAMAFLMLNSQRLAQELFESQKELEDLATTDPLTGISNRLKLNELGNNEMIRSRRLNHPFSVIVFDIDHFKEVNDTCGHPIGDKLLVELTQKIKAEIRDIDFFGRLGGDEFVLLFPETSIQKCHAVAERLRQLTNDVALQFEDIKVHVSISLGIAEMTLEDSTIEDLLKRADENLYKAKHSGRNITFGKDDSLELLSKISKEKLEN
ncbi:diguanylate cyclase [Desulfitobacterium sp. LBE]|uniref:GGDEF domain-containing protein n=1 Tax=Desulfitobacterium sp. LBE TaxID=884086 RepID=UPI00119A912E|nr:GGDEF domain-containing protein [Desulfitobacterium sp. LBE]TWH59437.1 diguanylate cyclase [Desulfitobacterium sp. LBE]